MNDEIRRLLREIGVLQDQVEDYFESTKQNFRYTLDTGRVHFSKEVQQFQKQFRASILPYIVHARWRIILTAPVIYSMILPLAILDLTFTIYQHICFRAYGVTRVTRRDFMVNDRHKLGYLNALQKINCSYCGYATGVMSYAREIVSCTEQYWCPIRHANRLKDPHDRYPQFFAFGDAKGFQSGLSGKRHELQRSSRWSEGTED